MSPRARQAPPPVLPAPGAEPPPRPAPGSSSSLYNAAGGPPPPLVSARVPDSAGPQGFRTGPPPPPPSGPAPIREPRLEPEAGSQEGRRRARTPTRNNRLPPRPAGSGGGGGGRAQRRLRGGGRKMAAGTSRPPAPPPRLPARLGPAGRGTREAPRAVQGVIGGPGPGILRSDPPSATCGWGCGVPADLEGATEVGRVPLGGHTSPWKTGLCAEGGVGGGGCRYAWLFPIPVAGRGSRGGGGGAAAVWGRGGGGRRSPAWAAGAGKRRDGSSGAAAGSNEGGGARGRPLQQQHPPVHTHTHADTLTHTHPRWAGADVSLKASHLYCEGRGLAEAADRGLRAQVPAPWETPSFRAAGGRGPCPALTLPPLPQAALPFFPLGADRAGVGPGPAPGLPQPPIAGARRPPAAKTAFGFPGASLLGGTHSLSTPSLFFSFSLHPLRPSSSSLYCEAS